MSIWSAPTIKLDFVEPHPPERSILHRAVVLVIGKNGLDCNLYAQAHNGRLGLVHGLFYSTIPAVNTTEACMVYAAMLAQMMGCPLIVERAT